MGAIEQATLWICGTVIAAAIAIIIAIKSNKKD